MSKESKSRDRWRHVGQSEYDGVCVGCGFYFVVHQKHRDDCTKIKSRAAK